MADTLAQTAPTAPAVPATTGLAPAGERGSLQVADRVVERIAEFAALDHPAVLRHESRLSRVTGRDLPRVTATVGGTQVRLHVEIAVAWPAPLAGTASEVRAHVAQEVSRLAGMHPERVDVSVRTVLRPTGPVGRRVA